MTRSVAGMGAAAAVSRAFGGLRMVVIAAVLGTTYLGNTFQASNSVSNVLFELLAAGALSAVLVPTFVDLLGRGERRRAEEVAGGVLSIALVGLGVVSVLGHRVRARSSPGCSPPASATRRSPRTSASWPPSCCGSSSRRCCSTPSARWPPRCSTPRAASRSPPSRRSATRSCSWRRWSSSDSMAGGDPGPRPLRRASGSCLALGGTLGVAAFVGRAGRRAAAHRVPPAARPAPGRCATSTCGACSACRAGRRSSTPAPASCSPRRSSWRGGVAGGVVAYQLAMVVFLAPYGIVAQPIHTAVLPRLAADAAAGDADGPPRRPAVGGGRDGRRHPARGRRRWSRCRCRSCRCSPSARRAGATARAARRRAAGPGGRACPAYGGFLLLTRAAYALGDSRTPALASLGSRGRSARSAMLVAGAATDGAGRPRAPSAAPTPLAYALGAAVAGACGSARASARSSASRQLRPRRRSRSAVGAAAWAAMSAWSPDGRGLTSGRARRDRRRRRRRLRRRPARCSTPLPARGPAVQRLAAGAG